VALARVNAALARRHIDDLTAMAAAAVRDNSVEFSYVLRVQSWMTL
jgi:hypothetical protein